MKIEHLQIFLAILLVAAMSFVMLNSKEQREAMARFQLENEMTGEQAEKLVRGLQYNHYTVIVPKERGNCIFAEKGGIPLKTCLHKDEIFVILKFDSFQMKSEENGKLETLSVDAHHMKKSYEDLVALIDELLPHAGIKVREILYQVK